MAETKQKQKFEGLWKQITTLTGNAMPEKVAKVDTTKVQSIFLKVAADRDKKAEEAFELKLTAILDAKLALDKNIAKGREELAKKEEKEYEILNNELNQALGMIQQVKQQNQALIQQAGGNFSAPTEDSSSDGEQQ